MTFYVKVREKGKKAWYFLTATGTTRLKVHASRYTAEDADKSVAAHAADPENAHLEFKAVPMDPKAEKKPRTYSGGKKGTHAEFNRRMKDRARVECLYHGPGSRLNGVVSEVRFNSPKAFELRVDGNTYVVFKPKRVSDLTWLDDDTVEWKLWNGSTHRFKFLPPEEDDRETVAPGDEHYYAEPADMGETRFNTLLKVCADSPEQLRKVDVFRAMDTANNAGYSVAFGDWLSAKRPDLTDEVNAWYSAQVETALVDDVKVTVEEPKAFPMPDAKRVSPAKKGPDNDLCYRPALVLPGNLKDLAKLTSDNARYALNCVNVKSTNRGYRVEVTNGKVMVLVSGPNVVEVDNLAKDVPELAQCPNGAMKTLVPGKAWTEAFKKVPKKGATHLAMVLAEEGKTSASVAVLAGDKVAVTDLPRGDNARFPDVDVAWPTTKPVQTWKVDADMLAELLKVVADLVRGRGKKAPAPTVTLEFHPRNNRGGSSPVTLVTGNEFGQEVRAAFMPME